MRKDDVRGVGRPILIPLVARNFHDLERRTPMAYTIISDAFLTELLRNRVYFLNGNVDGGGLDECTPAMDYYDPTSCDGGTL